MKHKNIEAFIITIVCIIFIILCVLLATPANAYDGEPVRTERQINLQLTAEAMRAMGCPEDEIAPLSEAWWAEQEALDIIAKVIQHEADPQWCDWEHSVAVGAVVCNRVKSPYFPDSVREVVEQPGQYLKAYTSNFSGSTRLAYEAAKAALDGEHDVPSDCYWQDTHKQGVGVWRAFVCDTGWFRSTTYICRGIPGVA